MIAVISGKIVDAWKINPNAWLFKLKQLFNSFGDTPTKWEIFGGNAFLLKINYPEEALFIAMIIKAIFRQVEELDVAIDIGLGEEHSSAPNLRESKGSAYALSAWDQTDKIPKKSYFKIHLDDKELEEQFNLLLEFAMLNMNQWSVAEAEIVELCLLFSEKSQQELAEWLRIKQSAVSQRRGRAHLDLLLKLDNYFKEKILAISKKA